MEFSDIVKAFLPLLLIVGLLFGLLVFVRKYGLSIKGKESKQVKVNVISTQMLMPKRFISVVKIEDKLLVLGVSENSINLLKELDGSNINEVELNQPGNENFLSMLKKNMGLK